MKIGIDGNEANVEKKVGVSVYTFQLLKYFQSIADKDTQFVVYLRSKPNDRMPLPKKYFRYELIRKPFLWRDVFLPIRLYRRNNIDVFFSPAHYTPRFSPVPIVVTVHDLAYMYYPNEFLDRDLYKLTNWTEHAVAQAERIIAVSNSTKKDILHEYNVDSHKISVIYNGFKKLDTKKSLIDQSFLIPTKPFILYVGTIQPRKNISTLINAFNVIKDTYPDHQLLIVGKKGWLYGDIFDRVLDLELENRVIFSGFLSNAQLSELYKKASCYVLPSLYEGFGLPIIEAMSYGCPVLASNTSCLPEIGGDACLYFDPRDTNELANTMSRVLNNSSLRNKLIEKGIKRSKMFSWEKCAAETLKVIRSCCTK